MKQLLLIFAMILLDAMACSRHHDEDSIEVSTTQILLDSQVGASASFDVLSNGNWKISIDNPWIRVEPMSGSGDKKITVTAQSFSEGWQEVSRFCKISIYNERNTCEVVVIQR